MSRVDYRLESRSIHTGNLVCELPFSNLQSEFFINKEDNLRFTLPMDKVTRSEFYPGKHECWLWWYNRFSGLDQLIYSGPFWSATATSGDRTLACESESLLSYLAEREVRNYNKTDFQDNHAWNYVSGCQLGLGMDLRIVRGLYSNGMASVPVEIDPWAPRKVLDAITDLANTSGIDRQGFDFDIDSATRAFDTWYPRKGIVRNMTLSYPQEIRAYSDQVLARPMVTDLRMLGSGSGSKQWFTDVADPTSAQAFVGMQNTLNYAAAATREALASKGTYNLGLLKFPKIVPSVEINMEMIEFDPYSSIGDIFNIQINDGWAYYNQAMRQAGMQLTLSANVQETLTWYLNDTREVVDESSV